MTPLPWFKMPRRLWDSDLWQSMSPAHKVILFTMINEASHQGRGVPLLGEQVKLSPGELLRSRKWLAAKAGPGVSEKEVRTVINHLEMHGVLQKRAAILGAKVGANSGAKVRAKGNDIIFALDMAFFEIDAEQRAKVGANSGAKVRTKKGQTIPKTLDKDIEKTCVSHTGKSEIPKPDPELAKRKLQDFVTLFKGGNATNG